MCSPGLSNISVPGRQGLSEPIHQTGIVLGSVGEVEAVEAMEAVEAVEAAAASALGRGLTLTSQTRGQQERLHCC